MATKIANPQKLLEHKLGTALGAEKKVLTMLGKMEQKAQSSELKEGFSRHRQETEGQIRNLEQALSTIGAASTAHQDPVADGIAEHAEQLLGKVDESLTDAVLVGGAAETEHHEIAFYEGLITMAQNVGAEDIVPLLQENLEQEQRTLQEVEAATQRLSQQFASSAV
jgi:ferritin-like metal-binding protein YciE